MTTAYIPPVGTQGPTLPKITSQVPTTVPLSAALSPPRPLPSGTANTSIGVPI